MADSVGYAVPVTANFSSPVSATGYAFVSVPIRLVLTTKRTVPVIPTERTILQSE